MMALAWWSTWCEFDWYTKKKNRLKFQVIVTVHHRAFYLRLFYFFCFFFHRTCHKIRWNSNENPPWCTEIEFFLSNFFYFHEQCMDWWTHSYSACRCNTIYSTMVESRGCSCFIELNIFEGYPVDKQTVSVSHKKSFEHTDICILPKLSQMNSSDIRTKNRFRRIINLRQKGLNLLNYGSVIHDNEIYDTGLHVAMAGRVSQSSNFNENR